MKPANKNQKSEILQECIKALVSGALPPWKVESELVSHYSITPPENFNLAALCRQGFIEEMTAEKFEFIRVSEKPYKIHYSCPKDNLIWELDARDSEHKCSLCGGKLASLSQYGPLVSNYVGGCEIYFSYAGRLKVKGDLKQEFTNLLVYGTGLGPIGVTRGSHLINKLGGAEIKVSDFGRAVRCIGYIFDSDSLRRKAIEVIQNNLPAIRSEMNDKMSEFSGHINSIDFDDTESSGDFILYIDFVAEFKNFRGHGDTSRAVGFAKTELEALLRKQGITYRLGVIAQGHDGDLKPSPHNKRGRRVSAEIRIPCQDFEQLLKLPIEKFLSFVKIDSIGAQKLGCQFYSGMGGEIIPAVFKATQINPQSPLVSSFQNINARIEKGDVIYRVELPNVEVGIASSREGLISPVGREALRIMGIRTAKEFVACLAAQVLAGEFNLALEISREKLYSS
jgi:hypothetical protein